MNIQGTQPRDDKMNTTQLDASDGSQSETDEVIESKTKTEEVPGSTNTTDDQQNEKSMTFPLRLMSILSNSEHSKVISWLPNGESFCIYNKKELTDSVLPRYFKKSKFASFTRKLHRWQFVRISKGPKIGTYHHAYFKRDNVELCMKMSCLPQVKPSKNIQNNSGLFNMPYVTSLHSMQQPFLRPDAMSASRVADSHTLLSMMAHSHETRRNLMLHNQLLKQQQQQQAPPMVDLMNLQQRNQISNVLQSTPQTQLLHRLNPPMMAPTQQQLLQHEMDRLMESRNSAMRTNPLNTSTGLSSLLNPAKTALHDKIAQVELEIAALREAKLRQIAQERLLAQKEHMSSTYPKSFGSKSAVRSDIRRASAA